MVTVYPRLAELLLNCYVFWVGLVVLDVGKEVTEKSWVSCERVKGKE